MLHRIDEEKRTEYYAISLDDAYYAEQKVNNPLSIHCKSDCFHGACIRCKKPQCIEYFDCEFECKEIEDFAGSKNSRVCPVNAIGWSNAEQEFVIDSSKCIGCGLCANRCPFGAIFSSGKDSMQINTNRSNAHYYVIRSKEAVTAEQDKSAALARSITKTRSIQSEDVKHIKRIYKVMQEDQELANILCRNLFIALGFNCSIRRVGDVYTRMDALISKDGVVSPVEIEYRDDTLSAARNLLDDLAVLNDRYEVSPETCTPIALCLAIPKTRQGYFQVCEDVRKVLGIKIRTLTVGALLILEWNGIELEFNDDNFCLAFRETSIKHDLKNMLGSEPCTDSEGLGLFEATK